MGASAGEQQTLVPHLETAAAQETLLQHTDTAARQCLVAESAPSPVSASVQLTERPEMREARAEVSIAVRSTASVEANAQSELLVESETAATARDASEEVAWQQQQEEAEADFELELEERTQDAVHTEAVAAPTSVESRDFVFTAEQQEFEHTVDAADMTLAAEAEREQQRRQQWPQQEALSVEASAQRTAELLVASERETAAQSFAEEGETTAMMAQRRSEKFNPSALGDNVLAAL